jgi:protein-S-isoprenylcysteine O-methyltransferase Ste14
VSIVREADYWIIPAIWMGWALYWWLAARQVKPTARRESVASRLSHILPLLVAAALMMNSHLRIPGMNHVLVAQTPVSFAVGVVMTVAGCALRRVGASHPGLQLERHRDGEAGPCVDDERTLRVGAPSHLHGLAAGIGGDRDRDRPGAAAISFVIAVLAILQKTRIEERVMLEQFGDVYRAYRARVPRLIPFL